METKKLRLLKELLTSYIVEVPGGFKFSRVIYFEGKEAGKTFFAMYQRSILMCAFEDLFRVIKELEKADDELITVSVEVKDNEECQTLDIGKFTVDELEEIIQRAEIIYDFLISKHKLIMENRNDHRLDEKEEIIKEKNMKISDLREEVDRLRMQNTLLDAKNKGGIHREIPKAVHLGGGRIDVGYDPACGEPRNGHRTVNGR